MKQAQEKLEQMKKEKESAFVSSRRTQIVTPGRMKSEELKAALLTPTPSRKFGL